MPGRAAETIDGVDIRYERRRYGSGASTVFFTWLYYFDGKEWEVYGDPWPSSVIPRIQLLKAVADIKTKGDQ